MLEKKQIKSLIVPLMLSATLKIQAQISEALAVIGDHDESFASDEILLQQIVIPNVMLRDEDKELFWTNYMEFIRRDMEEGSGDVDTRRRIACELLKSIKNKEKIRAQIDHCLALFAENPIGNWKYKECAIYLVVSLVTKNISTDIVDVESFFRSFIVPELQCEDVCEDEDVNNCFPMLKAAALKFFFTMLGDWIPKHVAMPLVVYVVRFFESDVNVVHSYAAICIDKLLLLAKDDNPNGVVSLDICPLYFMTNLFGALLEKRPDSEENEYIMRCIMRVVEVSDIDPEVTILMLTRVLDWVCAYPPKSAVFNHFLFEAVFGLVRRACEEKKHHVVHTFQTCVVPSLLSLSDTELLYPLMFQLFAQLVDLNTPPVFVVSENDMPRIFDGFMVLKPDLWGKSENVPALVRLLVSLLRPYSM